MNYRQTMTSNNKKMSVDQPLETINGKRIEVILDHDNGGTHWQVFRDDEGMLRCTIRQSTGWVVVKVRNIETLLAKLVQMHVPYDHPNID